MTWLRLDTGFSRHPKFSGWKPAEKWAFLDLMSYCGEYRTDGQIPTDLTLLPRGVNERLLTLAERSGWLDRAENGTLAIHDWAYYNPKDVTAASRAKAYRDRNANRDEHRDETVTSRARDDVDVDVDGRPEGSGVNDTPPLPQPELQHVTDQIDASLNGANGHNPDADIDFSQQTAETRKRK